MEAEREVKRVHLNDKFCFDLPSDCIVNALSFITPRDACRCSIVAVSFRDAAKSDAVWERFLPHDYKQIISRLVDKSSSPLKRLQTKKDLFMYLCNHTTLIDGGLKSFWLEKWSGKKCFMLGARDLVIRGGEKPQHWQWIPLPESRFEEVAKLISAAIWVEIHGKINIHMLSSDTRYVAYLVYSTKYMPYKFCYQNAVGIVCMTGQKGKKNTICFDEPLNNGWLHPPTSDKYPVQREDEWIEVELGEFFINGGEDGELEMTLMHIKPCLKKGLVIQGIEIRPK